MKNGLAKNSENARGYTDVFLLSTFCLLDINANRVVLNRHPQNNNFDLKF